MIRASHTSLVLLPVQLDSRGVRQEEVVAGDVRLGGGVPAEVAAGAPGRGEVAVAVPVGGHHPGLVDGEPVLHTVTVCPEAKICEPREIVPAECMVAIVTNQIRSAYRYDNQRPDSCQS